MAGTIQAIGIAGITADGNRIAYALHGVGGKRGDFSVINVCDARSGSIIFGTYTNNSSNLSAIVGEYAKPSRWNWFHAGISLSEIAKRFDNRCPRTQCKGFVQITNDYANNRVTLSHDLIRDKSCALETRSDAPYVAPAPTDNIKLPTCRCGHEIHAPARCWNDSCNCRIDDVMGGTSNNVKPVINVQTNDVPPAIAHAPVQTDASTDPRLDIIWNEALPTLARSDSEQRESIKVVSDDLVAIKHVVALNSAAIGQLETTTADLASSVRALQDSQPTIIAITINSQPTITYDKLTHHLFPVLLRRLTRHDNVALVGPAGSGKSHVAAQCAEALNIGFRFTNFNAQSSKSDLIGFIDAAGYYHRTAFRDAYETGTLFLADEFDACNPGVALVLNGAIANGHCEFPDGQIKRHCNFYMVAAMNTFGRGASRVYNGRNQLDAATLDRYSILEWTYDVKIEQSLIAHLPTIAHDWLNYVHACREQITHHALPLVASTRSITMGAAALCDGETWEVVEEDYLWRGAPKESVTKVHSAISNNLRKL